MRNARRIALGAGLIALALLFVLPVSAQPPEGGPAFMGEVFPPELVMRHRHDIGLSDAQREAITEAVRTTQGEVLELRWQMLDEGEKLADLIRQPRVDEEAALEQAERVMSLEQRVKREHLRLLVRIKNALEPEQQEKLRALRPAGGPGRGPHGPGPGPGGGAGPDEGGW